MNNNGQSVMLAILFGVIIFIIGIMFINFLMTDVTTAKSELSCSDEANISDGTKLTCLIVGGTIPYFIVAIVGVTGGLLVKRFLQ